MARKKKKVSTDEKLGKIEKFRIKRDEAIKVYGNKKTNTRKIIIAYSGLNSYAIDSRGNKVEFVTKMGIPNKNSITFFKDMKALEFNKVYGGHVIEHKEFLEKGKIFEPIKKIESLEHDLRGIKIFAQYGLTKLGQKENDPIKNGELLETILVLPATFGIGYRMRVDNDMLDLTDLLDGRTFKNIGTKSLPEPAATLKGLGILTGFGNEGGHLTLDKAMMIAGLLKDKWQHTTPYGGNDVTKHHTRLIEAQFKAQNVTTHDLGEEDFRELKEEQLILRTVKRPDYDTLEARMVDIYLNDGTPIPIDVSRAEDEPHRDYVMKGIGGYMKLFNAIPKKTPVKVKDLIYTYQFITGLSLSPKGTGKVIQAEVNKRADGKFEIDEPLYIDDDGVQGAGALYDSIDQPQSFVRQKHNI